MVFIVQKVTKVNSAEVGQNSKKFHILQFVLAGGKKIVDHGGVTGKNRS